MSAKLCLNMIVKNEALIIEKCLASVAPWITRYEIVDTGSTDATIQIIRDYFEKLSIPGAIHHIPFKNFSQARNGALHAARASASDFDYILLCDADMELIVSDKDWLSKITLSPLGSRPAFYIRQTGGEMSYDNTRLVHKEHKAARYVGPTHEVLSGINAAAIRRVEGVRYLDHQNGSSRSEKYERDIRLLTEALEADPTDARSMFYLGQSHRELGHWDEAFKYYQQRVDAGGWEEEAWYAQYQIGRCYLASSNEAKGIEALIKAYNRRPTRVEPLYALANHFRLKSGHEQAALLFLNQAKRNLEESKPPQDLLFVEDWQYARGIREESSILGFYALDAETKEEGREDCFSLSVDPSVPYASRVLARSNSRFYAEALSEHMNVAWQQIGEPTPIGGETYYPMNPCIAHDQHGNLVCNVRYVNYVIQPNGSYKYEGAVRTQNKLYHMCMTPPQPCPFWIDNLDDARSGNSIVGYEDMRLFAWQGKLWALATVLDRNPLGHAQMMLLGLNSETHEIESGRLIHSPRNNEREKNWVPVIDDTLLHSDNGLDVLYTADPNMLLTIPSNSDGTARIYQSKERGTLALDHLRGSSQAIPFIGKGERPGFLYVSHEVVCESPRTYLHRFVWLCERTESGALKDLTPEVVSAPFFFKQLGIEFCCGIAEEHDKGIMHLSFGIRDHEAWIATVTSYHVYMMLWPGV